MVMICCTQTHALHVALFHFTVHCGHETGKLTQNPSVAKTQWRSFSKGSLCAETMRTESLTSPFTSVLLLWLLIYPTLID